MNNFKICFIYCANDGLLIRESIRFVRALEVPHGYEIEIISITDADSMASGYNKGISQSDAKYKVYLRQDVSIINKQLICDVVRLFVGNPKLGVLGVAGAKTVPVSGNWRDSKLAYGKLYEKTDLLFFGNPIASYEPVNIVDGSIIITQYDIPWREDLFNGWHFYDASQSLEFVQAGYEVGVPLQEKPWVIDDRLQQYEDGMGYNGYRMKFLTNYGKFFLPKVSVLIPAYNRPHLLELALQSALHQTYQHIEIIIGDDSTNNEVQEIVKPYLEEYDNLIYYKNEKNLALANFYKLYDKATGTYINYLMDDDLFHIEKIEKMVNYFEAYPDATIVTSYRDLIDADGKKLPPLSYTRKLFEEDTVIDGKAFGSFMLKDNFNYIGEPTTAMFRKSDVKKYGEFNNIEYAFYNDLATWISLMSKGKVIYIASPLSYFRQHEGQNQKNPTVMVYKIVEMINLIQDTRVEGFFADETNYFEALTTYLTRSLKTIRFYQDIDQTSYLTKYDVYQKLKTGLRALLGDVVK
jgi:glycosyltransferase involved in cell wall biosynthesis